MAGVGSSGLLGLQGLCGLFCVYLPCPMMARWAGGQHHYVRQLGFKVKPLS